MADTLTPNYKWVQPEVGGDAAVWGSTLNSDLAAIDAQVYANQQAITAGVAPIGSITMFGGATPPANWLLCNGQTLDTSVTPAYQPLFNVIGNAFNTALTGTQFALPNLQGVFAMGAGPSNALATTGGAASVTLTAAQLPAHAHPITDHTHTHPIDQTPHAHGDPGHSHGVNDPGHTHQYGAVLGGAGQIQIGSGYGQATEPTGGSGAGISIQGAGTGIQAAYANINGNATDAAWTGLSTTQNTGGGAAIPALPPYVAINFIIRYQ